MFYLALRVSRRKAAGESLFLSEQSSIPHPMRLEALAASVVKVAGRDVLATWKILISLGVAPVLYGFYSALATYAMFRSRRTQNLAIGYKMMTPFIVSAILPFMSYGTLKFGEAGLDVFKLVDVFIYAPPHLERSCFQIITPADISPHAWSAAFSGSNQVNASDAL